METTTNYLIILAVAMSINIALGVYLKIGIEKILFDKTVFINGILKAVILACSFYGLAFCFDHTDLSSLGITPELIMLSAIILYVGKACTNLMSILGVDVRKN